MHDSLSRFTSSLAVTLLLCALAPGCAASSAFRIHTSAGMPQAPILGGEFETRKKPQSAPAEENEKEKEGEDEPETMHQRLQPSLGVGYGLGVAVSDEGRVRESDNVHGHLGFSPVPGIAFGGLLFLSNTRDLVPDDSTNLGAGIYGRARFFENSGWVFSGYSSLLYAQNRNNANNCDQLLFGNEPKNADGTCKITWNSEALVQLTSLSLSLLVERKLSDTASLIFTPGLVYHQFNSTNHVDGEADIVMVKSHISPAGMGFLRLTSRALTFQIGAGATRFTSFNDEAARRWVYVGDASISLGLK